MLALWERLVRRRVLFCVAKDAFAESSSRYLARRGRVCWLDFFSEGVQPCLGQQYQAGQ